MKPSVKKVRDFFYVSHEDDSGAVALLCLAAVIALMLVAWVIFDAHQVTRDKSMLQGAADTAALSHAAVEARSMNMISYANIAKRSIVDIHSMYMGMYAAFIVWIIIKAAGCGYNLACWAEVILNLDLLADETASDFSNYQSNGDDAYLQDLTAIDNYQHYMQHITPWWGYSEQLSRGWRNGATTVVSFPPPPGQITVGLSSIQNLINTVNSILSLFGMQTIDLTVYHGNDNLPIAKTDYGTGEWAGQLVSPTKHPEFAAEHLINAWIHKNNSDEGAGTMLTFIMGIVLAGTAGMAYSESVFDDADDPYELDTGGSEAMWLKRTSNLAIAYLNDEQKMDEDLTKYEISADTYTDYEHAGGFLDDQMYKSSGIWTLAKSEITFIGDGFYGDEPDMWHPSWTARMRPVHLPGEFEDAGFSMFEAYSQVVPYLALSAQVASVQGANTLDAIAASIRDIVRLGLSSAAMGPSTASGIAK
jgi:hypothetical protein